MEKWKIEQKMKTNELKLTKQKIFEKKFYNDMAIIAL